MAHRHGNSSRISIVALMLAVLALSACTSPSASTQSTDTRSTVTTQPTVTTPAATIAQPAPASQNGESARQQEAALKSYFKDNFGGGGGQKPVSWYPAIKSLKFVEPDHVVMKTSISPTDSSKVRRIVTALNLYDKTPGAIEIFGRDGGLLFAKGQTIELKSYLTGKFGGVVKSVKFIGPDYVVVQTSLTSKDQSKLNAIRMALESYEGGPSVVELLGQDGDILPLTP